MDSALQCIANLAEFALWEVLDETVEKEYEVFGHPEGCRRRNSEDVVGCVCHAGVAEETGVAVSNKPAERRSLSGDVYETYDLSPSVRPTVIPSFTICFPRSVQSK